MTQRSRVARSAVALVVAMAAAVGMMVSFAAVPASAQSADACAISRFTAPDGTVDVTSYLQCLNPSVSSDTVAPGGTITFAGGGFAGGCVFDVYLLPGDVLLGTFTADASGNFSVVVTIPSDTAPGEYTLSAQCEDAEGNPLAVVKGIQVVAPGSATASSPSGALPYTGSSTLQLVGVGLALVLVGGAVVVGIRRRNTHSAV